MNRKTSSSPRRRGCRPVEVARGGQRGSERPVWSFRGSVTGPRSGMSGSPPSRGWRILGAV